MTSDRQMNSTLVFFVNGKKVTDQNVDPEWTLLYYLRHKLKLCGTKLGCAEGGCGACTVMVSKYDRMNNKILLLSATKPDITLLDKENKQMFVIELSCPAESNISRKENEKRCKYLDFLSELRKLYPGHFALNACLAPICTMHGLAVTTVEGIGSTKSKLHPAQERIAKAHGSQCGFCTPGIVMSMYTLLRNSPRPTMDDLDLAFQGNLCRCTGYRPIIEGYKTFTEDWEKMQNTKMTNGTCPMGENCCKNDKSNDEEQKLFEKSEFIPYDSTQEPIFPPELKLSGCLDTQELVFNGKNVKWFRPINLEALLELKNTYPNGKLIVGNTEIGVEVKFKYLQYPILIQTNYIPELINITDNNTSLRIGASVTLQDMENAMRNIIKFKPNHSTRIFASIIDMLYYFASKQIRNVAAVGGNIMTSSPISDLNPIFLAANAILEVSSKTRGPRKVIMDNEFFTGYRKNKIQNDEVLIAINIPYTKENQYFYAYKQAKRRDDDIAIVNTAVNVTILENKIIDIKLAFGGMAPTTVMASNTQKVLIGEEWNEKMLEKAYDHLINDLPLSSNAPGGMILYRRSLTLSLFFRAYLAVSQQLQINLPNNYLSGITGFHHKTPKSAQYFQIVSNATDSDSVGRPIPHISASKQASGEALYCDDLPSRYGELYMALVLSTRAHAEILSIDATEALKQDGVHAFYSAKDLNKKQNVAGPVYHDEEIFISKTVTSQGQVIGAIIAEDQITAQRAARKVKIDYKDLHPIIITIEDAIKYKSFFNEEPITIKNGNVEEAFKNSDHIIEGECRTGAQEHFYLETQASLVIPKIEDDEMEIYCSTQNISEISKFVSNMLGIPINRIVCKTKRLGGGFGGKESRSLLVALPAALAAFKLKRPIRCMLDRDEDMLTTGTRHPFLMKYKTSFNNDGKITGCEIYLYNNAGYSKDLSFAVMQRAAFHFQNSYLIPNVRVFGYICKTNLPSNTAFRGFGGPQGMFAAENMIRDIAEYLQKDVAIISKYNLYKENDSTHYNQKLTYCTLERCWNECLENANYFAKRKEIEEFNKLNRWKKRGITIVPTMFGIAFTELFMNQTGALVIVYTDGSVLLTHGGVEMGQGLHTKMIQVASRVLDVPVENIHISETSTDKVPNTSPTAASAGSDLNGMAVKIACETIVERLQPFKQKNPQGTWKDWVHAAYYHRVSLSATGFYRTPHIGYSFKTNSGNPFNYYTFGVACSEVEIDCLTGDHQVLKTDIVMDLGESLNPAIDVGQIEGGFIQGYGLFTLEEIVYSPTGILFTRGPGAYKIPGFSDIPVEFNVSLLKGAPNPRAVFASKAVGEPPLFLASSVLFAIREAIKSARKDAGVEESFRLNAPATAAKIRMACIDHLSKKFEEPDATTFTPWNVVP